MSGRKCQGCSLYTDSNHSLSVNILALLLSCFEYIQIYLIVFNLDRVDKYLFTHLVSNRSIKIGRIFHSV
jgi:hypothetical protein